jgi:hypothetical protein
MRILTTIGTAAIFPIDGYGVPNNGKPNPI